MRYVGYPLRNYLCIFQDDSMFLIGEITYISYSIKVMDK